MFYIWVRSHIVVYLEGELVLIETAYGSMVESANEPCAVDLAFISHIGRLTK